MTHATDGELLVLLDGESDDDGAMQRHVHECDSCRTRMEGIDSSSRHVSRSLDAVVVPVVSEAQFRQRLAVRKSRVIPRWQRPVTQAAAVVVVIAAVAGASPLRSWLMSRKESSRGAISREVVQPKSVETATHRAGASIAFAPRDSEFVVRFDSVPGDGVLTLKRTSEKMIRAQVVDGAGTGGDALVVLPGELRVRNTSGARANYDVSLPAMVTQVRVVIAGHVVYAGVPGGTVALARSTRN